MTYVDIFISIMMLVAIILIVLAPERSEDEKTYGGMAHLMKITSYIFGIGMVGYYVSENAHRFKPDCTEEQIGDEMQLCRQPPRIISLTKEEYEKKHKDTIGY